MGKEINKMAVEIEKDREKYENKVNRDCDTCVLYIKKVKALEYKVSDLTRDRDSVV